MQELIDKLKSFSIVARVTIIILSLAFAIILVPIYLIWAKTNWSKGIKTILSVAVVLLVSFFGYKAEMQESTTAAIITPQVEPSSQVVREEPKSKNPYVELSKDKDSYLLLLKTVTEYYTNNTLSQESLNTVQNNSAVAPLVEDVISYKHQSNSLSPDFAESFSLFWNEEISRQNAEISESLKKSFDIYYNAIQKQWTITPIINDTMLSVDEAESYNWLSALGHLWLSVDLYIGKDNEKFQYAKVMNLNDEKVQLYFYASDQIEWVERRGTLMTTLYVRSDDPNLPQNQ